MNDELKKQYIDEFLKNSKLNTFYAIRDNCGPCAYDFVLYMETKHNILLRRIRGEFRCDKPVHTKKDFYPEEIEDMKHKNLNPNNDSDRIKYMNDNNLVERQKLIPHYWTVMEDNTIIDPSGFLQFVKTGLAKDLNDSRYISEE